ncbi:nucleoside-diphosphate sugar epimerase/dehydratase [Mangrovimonas yunxiaonensis]|uniref:nucleoside-diphosphate sugar epimerase/dehydratase n=1 Tax=Mangrovimonas yunxiaonensis TaxID=1197477 RepID=UPI000689430B|nr:nucleoside-diphosphate sugar epimerase/dehydratase [Mangrovimonas yunxiaonensis]GGH35284.1 polysaccharide biosynthesis protein CapD [Mangrovimonas yunxiaonensis]
MKYLERKFKDLGYLPRWIILSIDTIIMIVACVPTFLIVSNLTLRSYDAFSVSARYGMVVVVHLFCFVIFRTYAGVIRHSTVSDAQRLLGANFVAFMVLLLLNYGYYAVMGTKIFLVPALIINFVLSFIMLFAFRIAVKFLFENYLSFERRRQLTRVAIYGTDANAVALANALKTEQPARYQLVGFVGSKKSALAKELMGVPIIRKKKNIAPVLRLLKAEAVIISDRKLPKSTKLQIVENCLAFNYQVLTLPPIVDWEAQQQISKRIKTFDIKDLLERSPIVLDNHKIAEQLKGKVLLVTGAAGSIGSEIAYQVLNFGPEKVVLVDQAETPLHHLSLQFDKLNKPVELVSIVADVKDATIMGRIFETHRPEVVYHAAAYKHVPLMEDNPYQAIKTNVFGTKNLADLAVAYNTKRFVFVSTDKAVNPSNIMGASKRIAELYVQSQYFDKQNASQNTTKFITTRFGNVLGSNGSVVPLFTKQIEAGGPITLTHPDIIRYFMTIPEACQLVLEAGAMGNGGEIFIFDMGEPVKIIDLARKMIRLAGFVPEQDIPIKIIGLRPGEKLYEELLNDTAKTLPTHHEKIMISVDKQYDDVKAFEALIAQLLTHTNQLDLDDMVALMKQIVPEFISKNSEYEKLDQVTPETSKTSKEA